MALKKNPKYRIFLVPVLVGLLAWVLSESWGLGLLIFFATLAGNWIMEKKK